MKKLKEKERRNSHDYFLKKRNEYAAIYSQVDDETKLIIAHEVFKIKKRKETFIGENKIEAGEVFPGKEEFGKSAWTYPTFVSLGNSKEEYERKIYLSYEKALNKFETIKNVEKDEETEEKE
ncbi:MAG: hypothetical protein ACOCP8_08105 [archaeon]